jgi:hypothetical protein
MDSGQSGCREQPVAPDDRSNRGDLLLVAAVDVNELQVGCDAVFALGDPLTAVRRPRWCAGSRKRGCIVPLGEDRR